MLILASVLERISINFYCFVTNGVTLPYDLHLIVCYEWTKTVVINHTVIAASDLKRTIIIIRAIICISTKNNDNSSSMVQSFLVSN